MNRRIAAASLVLVVGACFVGPWRPSFEEVELGVDVRLNAVEAIYYESFTAVGSGGTIVRDDGRVWQVGNAELRDIEHAPDSEPDGPWTWFVVGDAGTIAVGLQSNLDADVEWTVQESGTTANLHAIMVREETTPIAVGEEVVLIGQPSAEPDSFEWIVEPAPPGGWGRLRDVEIAYDDRTNGRQVRMVGLDGRMWLSDTQLETWQSIDAGTDEDLFDIDRDEVCGARGTIVTCGDGYDAGLDECTSERIGDVDFLACDGDSRLGSDQAIHVDYRKGKVYELDFQPRAIDELWGMVVVGDGGRAGWWYANTLHEY